jgi:hypothetical protein
MRALRDGGFSSRLNFPAMKVILEEKDIDFIINGALIRLFLD